MNEEKKSWIKKEPMSDLKKRTTHTAAFSMWVFIFLTAAIVFALEMVIQADNIFFNKQLVVVIFSFLLCIEPLMIADGIRSKMAMMSPKIISNNIDTSTSSDNGIVDMIPAETNEVGTKKDFDFYAITLGGLHVPKLGFSWDGKALAFVAKPLFELQGKCGSIHGVMERVSFSELPPHLKNALMTYPNLEKYYDKNGDYWLVRTPITPWDLDTMSYINSLNIALKTKDNEIEVLKQDKHDLISEKQMTRIGNMLQTPYNTTPLNEQNRDDQSGGERRDRRGDNF